MGSTHTHTHTHLIEFMMVINFFIFRWFWFVSALRSNIDVAVFVCVCVCCISWTLVWSQNARKQLVEGLIGVSSLFDDIIFISSAVGTEGNTEQLCVAPVWPVTKVCVCEWEKVCESVCVLESVCEIVNVCVVHVPLLFS